MKLISRFYLLTFLLLFQSNNAMAASCWANLKSSSASRYFILAMGANTGKLKRANHDAQAFANAMQKRFKVPSSLMCVLKNIKFWDFKKALKRLQKRVKKKDKVLIYFSGHGKTLKDIKNKDEKDCLDEAFVLYRSPALRDDDFVSLVNKIKTNKIITFIDSCFASGMLRGKKRCSKGIQIKFQLNPKTVDTLPNRSCPGSRLRKKLKGKLYAAAKENQLAWEYPKKGGIFTYTFLKHLKAAPSASLDNIFRRTAKQVARQTRGTCCQQQPQKWQ